MDQYLRRLSLFNPLHLCAVGFGSGLAPKAPGTFGTLAAVPLMGLLSWWLTPYQYAICLIIGFIFGVWCCQVASKAMKVHDHGGIVWDEFIGFGVALLMIPVSWKSLLSGFILFRLFDILKPWPISWLDKRVSGGFGIMVDDLLAGVFALCCQWLLFFYSGWV
ncbi:MAG: Phosphatidylglycerophosphatase A [Candidatus Celerinatantimonas neptuna]|nr:MAG: Phosphatidylglycerophosphatase A [Candidatus Celerinatantimonas neptuna]